LRRRTSPRRWLEARTALQVNREAQVGPRLLQISNASLSRLTMLSLSTAVVVGVSYSCAVGIAGIVLVLMPGVKLVADATSIRFGIRFHFIRFRAIQFHIPGSIVRPFLWSQYQ
jgi:hypothetical protein